MEFTDDFRYALVDVITYDPKSFSSSYKWSLFDQYYMFETNLNINVGVEEALRQAQGDNLIVFPNPATETATVEINLSEPCKIHIELLNILGQNVLPTKTSEVLETSEVYREQLDLSGLAPGIYFVVINAGKERIIKELVKY